MLTLTDTQIPKPLQIIPNPPKTLYVMSDSLEDLLSRPRVAIVGSRKVTPYGRGVTKQFASELASKGIVIVSGLAFGVDAIAHQAALDAGGQTLAVLPSGISRVYPSSHQQLANNIVRQGGALISEYQDGDKSYPGNFVSRNRLVSGISDVLLVTEAATHSGTMHTANFASQQGKIVFAVPGNITSPLSSGTNNLIKNGAKLITESADILKALGISGKKLTNNIKSNNPKEQAIIDLLQSGITDGGELLFGSKLNAQQFAQTMTMLEIKGIITPTGNNHWSL